MANCSSTNRAAGLPRCCSVAGTISSFSRIAQRSRMRLHADRSSSSAYMTSRPFAGIQIWN